MEKTKELEAGSRIQLVLLPFTLERASCKDPIVWESSNWNFRLWPLEMKECINPCYTKVSVTKTFVVTNLWFVWGSENIIKEFHTPLEKYDACLKYCITLERPIMSRL